MATMTLDELVAQLRSAFGAELRAVVLYGSAASGEHHAKHSDYNVLVLVEQLDLERLRREGAIARSWREAGNPPPLTFTVDEWRHSLDVFPMEYADILARHRVLHGSPPFEGLAISMADLRVQAEREALAKLLQLRHGVMSASGDPKRLTELLAASVSTFMAIFRAVVRLHGQEPDWDYEALCRRVTALSGIDTAAFLQVVQHVRGRSSIREQDLDSVLAGYLAGAHEVYTHIDQLPTP
jgi:predicted nucleotidyltransferase